MAAYPRIVLFPLLAVLGCGPGGVRMRHSSFPPGAITFPESTASVQVDFPERRIDIVPVPPQERGQVEKVLNEAMSLYPPGLLAEATQGGILPVGALNIDGAQMGGYTGGEGGAMLLKVSASLVPIGTWARFHHETFHALRIAHYEAFPKAEWEAALPAGFRYRGGDAVAQVSMAPPQYRAAPELVVQGFAREYGLLSIDEDAATIAEAMMLNDRWVLGRLQQSPALWTKCRLIIKFYRSIDPAFAPPEGWESSGSPQVDPSGEQVLAGGGRNGP